jgi:DNA-binding TFAR19-related protein (PDSD5 family)
MQEDPELAAIRAARLSQLQQNGGGGDNEEENKQRATAAAAEEQMRRDLLATVLDAPARERRMSLHIIFSRLLELIIELHFCC